MKKRFLFAIAAGLSVLLLCSSCFAKIKKEYEPAKMDLTVSSFTEANCGQNDTWVYMSMFKSYDFSKKRNIDKADVFRCFNFWRLTDKPEPYVSVEVRSLDGSSIHQLTPMLNKSDPHKNQYWNLIGFSLSRGLIGKSVFGNNDPLISFIKKQEPFYIDITYDNGETFTVSELIQGQVLKDWLTVWEHDLEKDQEWYSKMLALYPRKK